MFYDLFKMEEFLNTIALFSVTYLSYGFMNKYLYPGFINKISKRYIIVYKVRSRFVFYF